MCQVLTGLAAGIYGYEQVRQDPTLLVANTLMGRQSINRQKKVISERSAMKVVNNRAM